MSERKSESVIAQHPPSDGREWDCQCARCGSSCDWVDCWNCHDGYSHHDCMDDCCCCLDKSPNVVCDECHGHGGWWGCLSSASGCNANPLWGRGNVPRGQIEWFTVDEAKP